MGEPTRRSFLGGAAAAAGGVVLGSAALSALASCGRADTPAKPRRPDYGPLAPAPDAKDGVVRLAVPAGFSYVTLGIEGTPMSDGVPTPGAHDGMGAFQGKRGHVVLVRNHEAREPAATSKVFGDTAAAYDAKGCGGTTTLEVDVRGEMPTLVSDGVSCNGTIVNCAGGTTPWDSWLTCEETTAGVAQGFAQPHGYVFEVPAKATSLRAARPIPEMGRFVHEAVAIDPRSGVAYLTEDAKDSGFYRFVPEKRGQLDAGGKLQMLGVEGAPAYDTRTGQKPAAMRTVWIDIANPDPQDADANPAAVYQQGLAGGGATFARLEGAWYGKGSIFFNATSGGDAQMGQVWEYRPAGRDHGSLRLVFESPSKDVLASPDNIVVSPRGGLILCEDSANDQQFMRGLTTAGHLFGFATNLVHDGEWAGATFSPGGRVLFANIQGDTRSGGKGQKGMTFAIWGPWQDGPL